MKTLVYSSIAVFSPRLHVLLSVMQEAIDSGEKVVFVGCDGTLPACVSNLDHVRAICRYCTAWKDKGLSLVTGDFSRKHLSHYLEEGDPGRISGSTDGFEDLAALRSLEYRGADVGYAALSSYIHATRELSPDIGNPVVRGTLQQLVNAGKLVYEAFSKALSRESPDRVVLFNGRLAADRAVLRSCQDAGVDCYVYEVTQKDDHVTFFKNALPQDILYTARAMQEFWVNGPEEKVEIARSFFEKRKKGVFTSDNVYTDVQVDDKLPSPWDDGFRNIVIYSSSEDEYAAIGREWEDNLYPSQFDAVHRICRSLAMEEKIRVYLRLHPNLRGLDRPYVDDLMRLGRELDNLIVVPADSEVSSYAMLDRADVVLTFASTVGIEAVYWGKPCILLGNSVYKPLGATYNPRDHDEVIRLVRSRLAPKDPTPALMLAYYRMKNGFKQLHYQGDRLKGRSRGYSFKGDRVRVRGLTRLLYKLAKRRWQANAIHRPGRA